MGIEFVKDERDKQAFDPTQLVHKDPEKYYRLARKNDMVLARHKRNGYVVSSGKTALALEEAGLLPASVDTTHGMSDLILMETSKANHDRLMQDRAAAIKARTDGVRNTYRQKVNADAGRRVDFDEPTDNAAMAGMTAEQHDEAERQSRRRR